MSKGATGGAEFMSKGGTGGVERVDKKGCQVSATSTGAAGMAELRDKMGRLLRGWQLLWDTIWVVLCM